MTARHKDDMGALLRSECPLLPPKADKGRWQLTTYCGHIQVALRWDHTASIKAPAPY